MPFPDGTPWSAEEERQREGWVYVQHNIVNSANKLRASGHYQPAETEQDEQRRVHCQRVQRLAKRLFLLGMRRWWLPWLPCPARLARESFDYAEAFIREREQREQQR